MAYPAVTPGVVVGIALDWSGEIAEYNCYVPLGASVHTVGAPGGIESDPLGMITRPGGPSRTLYGSSYAAALVGAALAA
jgi:hypothetical protein